MMNKTILIMEDDQTLLRSVKEELVDQGLETIESQDGKEGLEIALAKHPDLILIDLNLPSMHGNEVMRKLREDTWGKNVPIVVFTVSETDDEKLKEIVELKPAYYLVKSAWKLEDVVGKVREILGVS